MKITQIRNATIVLEYENQTILVDPMLAPKGSVPSLKYLTKNRIRNPIVELPPNTEELLQKVTHCLITHCQKGHFDHLDSTATKWLREKNIPVYCADEDLAYLQGKGLNAQGLQPTRNNMFLNGRIQLIPCVHGKGLIGKMMAHGYGYFIELPDAPTVYLTGDTILTNKVEQFIRSHEPEITVIPAGGAHFDIGDDIIMGLNEAIYVGQFSKKWVIANHLETLDHCPVTRKALRQEAIKQGIDHRFLIPNDGDTMCFDFSPDSTSRPNISNSEVFGANLVHPNVVQK